MTTTAKQVYLSTLLTRVNSHLGTKYQRFKPEQEAMLHSAGFLKKDVLGVLPTGFGKSIVLDSAPFFDQQAASPVIGICPLDAILMEQKQKYGEMAVIVNRGVINEIHYLETSFGPCSEAVDRMLLGNTLYILGHPEHITDDMFVRIFLRKFSGRINAIIVDEAHCLLSWGNPEFRPSFKKIPALRSVLTTACVIALTATATPKSQRLLLTELRMEEAAIVAGCPDRANLRMEVRERPSSTGGGHDPYDSIDWVIQPLINELLRETYNFPKTVVFVSNLQWCGYCLHFAIRALASSHAIPDLQSSAVYSELVGQYHAAQTKQTKDSLSSEFRKEESRLRLIFATEAYSMGVDVRDIRRIIHIGPPTNLEVFTQEIGRCGRDGKPSEVILYYNQTDIRENNLHLESAMREYCRASVCRRSQILQYFGFEKKESLAECCDICLGWDTDTGIKTTGAASRGRVDAKLASALKTYFESINAAVEVEGRLASIRTGLSPTLADELSGLDGKLDEGRISSLYPELPEEIIKLIVRFITNYT